MAEVGVGLDALDDQDAVVVGQLAVAPIEFGIARKLSMLGEADRAQPRATFDYCFDIFLWRSFGIIRKIRMNVKIDDHRASRLAAVCVGVGANNHMIDDAGCAG